MSTKTTTTGRSKARRTAHAERPARRPKIGVTRHFTRGMNGLNDVFASVQWELRDATNGRDFHQANVEFPTTWSQNATNIVAEKYFRGRLNSPDRERSVKQMISRVAETITTWGQQRGYFATTAEHDAFGDELAYVLLHQMGAFNSPVWFNVGFEDHPQCAACFLLSVQDTFDDGHWYADPDRNPDTIDAWLLKEGRIFRGGSGSGINLSNIRGSQEQMSKGGLASGPISFMAAADAYAGVIKSGGKTRRAAKMVVLDIDHPDIVEFIAIKPDQERIARLLGEAGENMRLDSVRYARNVQFQNANISVSVSDAFMRSVERDEDWHLLARAERDEHGNPKIIATHKARELMRRIVRAAWECADPGMHFNTRMNEWHTNPNTGPITTSNPCSEFISIDDSACNLASLNVMKYRRDNGSFDLDAYEHTIDIMFLAQEIIVGTREQPASSYPTPQIAANAHDYRQLGLGMSNLGALLMSYGMPYDSEDGRALAGALTSLMTARAYRQSTVFAARMGAYAGYERNRDAHLNVMAKHQRAHHEMAGAGHGPQSTTFRAMPRYMDVIAERAGERWHDVLDRGKVHGFRNAQATLMAPTGTISFLMDCDTTGVEPDFSLVKYKQLVGGGTMTIANQTLPLALRTLGYDEVRVKEIADWALEHGDLVDCPLLDAVHLPVFDVAVGRRPISAMGHIRMMAAIQPFLSGAISKTINMPNEATEQDVAEAYLHAWRLGLKAMAIYRDGSKATQALSTSAQDGPVDIGERIVLRVDEAQQLVARAVAEAEAKPARRKMGRQRQSITHKAVVGSEEFYITAGFREDGTLGEIFLSDIGEEGSMLRGLGNSFATAISLALQYGVPLDSLVEKFHLQEFGSSGFTRFDAIPTARSIVSYTMKWLAFQFLAAEDCTQRFGVRLTDEQITIKQQYPNMPLETALLIDRYTHGNGNGAATSSTPVVEISAVEDHTAGPIPVAEPQLDAAAVAVAELPRVAAPTYLREPCGVCHERTLRPNGACTICDTCGAQGGCG